MTAIDPSALPGAAALSPTAGDPLTAAVERFAATGEIDLAPFAAAAPEALTQAFQSLSPRRQGDLQRQLGERGLLGGLVGEAVKGVGKTVAQTTDAAIETRSERQAQETSERIESSRLDRWMGEIRGQADIDFVLAPLSKQERPPAALASTTQTRSAIEAGQPGLVDDDR
jgi:hypothetical protein